MNSYVKLAPKLFHSRQGHMRKLAARKDLGENTAPDHTNFPGNSPRCKDKSANSANPVIPTIRDVFDGEPFSEFENCTKLQLKKADVCFLTSNVQACMRPRTPEDVLQSPVLLGEIMKLDNLAK